MAFIKPSSPIPPGRPSRVLNADAIVIGPVDPEGLDHLGGPFTGDGRVICTRCRRALTAEAWVVRDCRAPA